MKLSLVFNYITFHYFLYLPLSNYIKFPDNKRYHDKLLLLIPGNVHLIFRKLYLHCHCFGESLSHIYHVYQPSTKLKTIIMS